MFAWVRRLFAAAPVPGSSNPMPDQPYWDMVLQNIADMRVWLTQVEAQIPHAAYTAPRAAPPTLSVDDEVAAADSVTRVHKALEREFGVDRRTVYQRVERYVAAYQIERIVPDWRENVAFHKRMAVRNDAGKTYLERALAALDAKKVAAQ